MQAAVVPAVNSSWQVKDVPQPWVHATARGFKEESEPRRGFLANVTIAVQVLACRCIRALPTKSGRLKTKPSHRNRSRSRSSSSSSSQNNDK